jgi:hypothetical protein
MAQGGPHQEAMAISLSGETFRQAGGAKGIRNEDTLISPNSAHKRLMTGHAVQIEPGLLSESQKTGIFQMWAGDFRLFRSKIVQI